MSMDIPDLSGKVIIVTGGNGGIGKAAIVTLAKKHPQHIYLTARNASKCLVAIDEIRKQVPDASVSFLECDLASLDSVKAAAKEFLASSSRLDILICSAGVMAIPPGLTKDGYEIQFGTNHLGHALLIQLLLRKLQETAASGGDARIVLVTSQGMALHPPGGIVFNGLHTTQEEFAFGRWRRYGQSKLANILYASELARRHPSITSVSVHPGVVFTGLVTGLGFWDRALIRVTAARQIVTPEKGAQNLVWAATAPRSTIVNGEYYEPVGVPGKHVERSKDVDLARRLWEWTDEELLKYKDE